MAASLDPDRLDRAEVALDGNHRLEPLDEPIRGSRPPRARCSVAGVSPVVRDVSGKSLAIIERR